MNRDPQQREFDPSSPLLRKIFALVAMAATVATLGFIDALAHGYGAPVPLIAHDAPIAVAQR